MTEENIMTTTPVEDKEINNEVLNMTPTEDEAEYIDDEMIFDDYVPLDKKTVIADTEDIEIYGSLTQRIQMFADWANYTGEVENPNTTAVNPFFKKPDGTGSLYAPLDEVLKTTKPILSKHGFGLIQVPIIKAGQVSIKTILPHKSGGLMSFPKFTLPISKNDAQGIIAGTTYARRGGITPLLGVHGEVDDDGNEAAGAKPQEGSKKGTPENDELSPIKNNLILIIKELGGSKNPAVMDVVKKVEPSGNVNKIADKDVANTLYTDLQTLRETINTAKEGK